LVGIGHAEDSFPFSQLTGGVSRAKNRVTAAHGCTWGRPSTLPLFSPLPFFQKDISGQDSATNTKEEEQALLLARDLSQKGTETL